MAREQVLITAAALIASPVWASEDETVAEGAPPASESALYCLRMEPITGTRIGSIMCWTRQEWADNDINIDEVWAEDGVRVDG